MLEIERKMNFRLSQVATVAHKTKVSYRRRRMVIYWWPFCRQRFWHPSPWASRHIQRHSYVVASEGSTYFTIHRNEASAPRRLPWIALQSPRLYSNAALATLHIQTYAPLPNSHAIPWTCEHFCAPVIHPVTGEAITKYKKLVDDPIT